MYRNFPDMDTVMFRTREQMGNLPKVFRSMENIRCIVDCTVFRSMENIRCIVDCTEFKVEMSRDFAQQGNTYSAYKHSMKKHFQMPYSCHTPWRGVLCFRFI